jgi:hypothetical protein
MMPSSAAQPLLSLLAEAQMKYNLKVESITDPVETDKAMRILNEQAHRTEKGH